jgi:hypothetical protein
MALDNEGRIIEANQDTCIRYSPNKDKPLGAESIKSGKLYECRNMTGNICVMCDNYQDKSDTDTIVAQDVMIDLETVGNDYNGIFTNIGACVFNPKTGEIGDTFYRAITWESSVEAGRTFTPDTIKWWMQQSDGARKEILAEGEPLDKVLKDFASFLPEDPTVWGNGCNFDIGKLETAYGYYNIPWKFRAVRDVRTVCDLARGLVNKRDVPFEGVEHNALDDAIHQAKYVSKMVMAIEDLKNKVNK